MKCPNKCNTELVEIQKPAWVLIDVDVMDYLPEDVKQTVTVCTLIHRICPKCGFHMNQHLNQKEWSLFLEGIK